MSDMLVKLYDLMDWTDLRVKLGESGIVPRRAMVPEKYIVTDWVENNFNESWKAECDAAFARRPVSCFIAVEKEKVIGFACYDVTRKGFFGPTGVEESTRGKGVGTALLMLCLEDMYHQGYGYAIIGGAGPVNYYEKTVGAIEIKDSKPGIYKGMLKRI